MQTRSSTGMSLDDIPIVFEEHARVLSLVQSYVLPSSPTLYLCKSVIVPAAALVLLLPPLVATTIATAATTTTAAATTTTTYRL